MPNLSEKRRRSRRRNGYIPLRPGFCPVHGRHKRDCIGCREHLHKIYRLEKQRKVVELQETAENNG